MRWNLFNSNMQASAPAWIFPWLASFLVVTFLSISVSHAEPVMRSIEIPLEGTSISSYRIDGSGTGHAVMSCNRCEGNRIRLKITPVSVVILNGKIYPMSSYTPSKSDFTTGYFNPDTLELTKLKVMR